MSSRRVPVKRTATIPIDRDCIGTVAHDDCLILFSVTRVPWTSNDEEERVRQRCRLLQTAVRRADALADDDGTIPIEHAYWAK